MKTLKDQRITRKNGYERDIVDCWNTYKKDDVPASLAFNTVTNETSYEECFASDHPNRYNPDVKVFSPIGYVSEKQFKTAVSKGIYGFDIWA